MEITPCGGRFKKKKKKGRFWTAKCECTKNASFQKKLCHTKKIGGVVTTTPPYLMRLWHIYATLSPFWGWGRFWPYDDFDRLRVREGGSLSKKLGGQLPVQARDTPLGTPRCRRRGKKPQIQKNISILGPPRRGGGDQVRLLPKLHL